MAVTNGYADGDDAQAYLNQLGGAALTLSDSSTPKLEQVEGWLDSLAAEVDALLTGAGYGTIPATGTNDVLFIGRFVAQKGAAMAFGAGFMYDKVPDKIERWNDEWDAFLANLIDGKYRLIDQSPRAKAGVKFAQRYVES